MTVEELRDELNKQIAAGRGWYRVVWCETAPDRVREVGELLPHHSGNLELAE